jgi:hypothetical protein
MTATMMILFQGESFSVMQGIHSGYEWPLAHEEVLYFR